MKLKNKVISTIFGVIASSFVFISVPQSANAEQCSAANPCHTYAVLDNANRVINLIVCQTTVCGSGTFGGNRVILQVLGNPQTNDTTGTSGHITDPEKNKVVTYSDNGVFTVKKDEVVIHAVAVPEIQTQNTNDTITTTTTSVQAQFSGNSAKVDATQIINSKTTLDSNINNTNTVNETIVFEQRKTAIEVSSILVQQNLVLLQSKINKLLILLDGWLL
jgi:hypothetical protein